MRRWLRGWSIEIVLEGRGTKLLLLAATGVLGTWVSAQALRITLAASFEESFNPSEIRRALALDPGSPELHRRLGLIYLYTLDQLNPPEGVKELRRATEFDLYQARAWLELGAGCDLVLDTECADRAFERALALSPLTPRVHWMAANHYLSTNRPEVALSRFENLLRMAPEYAPQTFAVCLRALDNPETLYTKVLPPENEPRLKLALIDYLCARGKADWAYGFWTQTAATASSFPLPLVNPYLSNLFDLGRYGELARVWQDLKRLGVIPTTNEDDGDLVYNGDFERPPLNLGLDWHFRREPYLALDFFDSTSCQGLHALRLDFTVARNEEYEPVFQIVPVNPNQDYRLSAQVRSDGISSDSGPRLRILDPACPRCLEVFTEGTVGTTPWRSVGVEFRTGPSTEMLRLSVWRPRSRTYPTEIAGQFWIDSVSLKAMDTPSRNPR